MGFLHFLSLILVGIFTLVYFVSKDARVQQFALYSYTISLLAALLVFAK